MTKPTPKRLLITGSRMWSNWDVIFHALAAEWVSYPPGSITLVSGNCPPRRDNKNTPGADYICEWYWENWGGPVERYPASWKVNGVVSKAAGFERNTFMTGLPGVYKCLAFQLDGSGGTQHCMDEARDRDVPVNIYRLESLNYGA